MILQSSLTIYQIQTSQFTIYQTKLQNFQEDFKSVFVPGLRLPVPPRRLLHDAVGPDEAAAQGAAQAGRGDLQGQLPARGAPPPRLVDRGELLTEGALQRE